jgi:dihydrofolate synthase/folylpolyglutamate synthase
MERPAVTSDALTRIRGRGHIGIRLGLARMVALLAALDDPQRSLNGVLVGGTNGKGSVAAMIAAVLAEAGYSTVQSPSPHLHSYRERVTIDGRPIPMIDLEPLLQDVLRASERAQAELGPATEFELFTAAAYLFAARHHIDLVVMEVGLGGRLDATNVWDPDVTAITNVGLDHREFLGDTLEAVAAEKAAIIKAGQRAVTGASGEALTVIAARASRVGVTLDVRAPLAVLGVDTAGTTVQHERLGELRLSLSGRHQAANASVALGALEALAAGGVARVGDDHIRAGLAGARWPGRMEFLRHEDSVIVLDGAHNTEGMVALVDTLDDVADRLPQGRVTLLLAIMRDKEVSTMLRALAGSARLRRARVITTTVPESDRSAPAAELAASWEAAGGESATPIEDPVEALEAAVRGARDDRGPIVIAGSLYLIGGLRGRLVGDAPSDPMADA